MNRIRLKIPSKTFMVGEYLALRGEPSLVAATGPEFELVMTLDRDGGFEGIHPRSPAGHWVRQNSTLFQNKRIRFIDPHGGQGGFGASTAQFLGVYALSKIFRGEPSFLETGVYAEEILTDYLSVVNSEKGPWPSGADLLAQLYGGLALVRKNPLKVASLQWPFGDYGFSILRTGQKMATHEHLKSVELSALDSLSHYNASALEAFEEGEWENFFEGIQNFALEMQHKNWVSEHSRKLLESLGNYPEVIAAKACGAMGADTLLVLHGRDQEKVLEQHGRELGLERVAGSGDLVTEGLKVEMSWGKEAPVRGLDA